MKYSKIIATGSYLPKKIVTNDDLAKLVDTNDEWIKSRVGISQRHFANESETIVEMSFHASKEAINKAKIDKNKIDMIIVATTSQDVIFPSAACLLQLKLEINNNCPAFDVQAVCSGFMYALSIADSYIKNNMAKTILIVGVDSLSKYLDFNDRSTCVLFGDGAGAVILQSSSKPGIIATNICADGSGEKALHIRSKITQGKIFGDPFIRMDGKAVFKMAVNNLASLASNLLKKAKFKHNDIDWFIPHQANIRIIESVAQKMNISMENVIVTIDHHGNTSAASIPLALNEGIKNKKIKRGQLLLLEGVGAGFTWGGALIKY